jgi:hypothetical protein
MVIFDKSVYKSIRKYSKYIIRENMCSIERTIEKVTLMVRTVMNDLDSCVSYRTSPYKQFGNPQGYRLYVYKDPHSKSQWGFAHQRFDDGNIIVRGMINMKLIRESDGIDKVLSLMERVDNLYK